jgi:2-succinyl-5-enolpyruvyl-6-hydroxy-3-cyclohexene-1-carboxylate synthase
LESIYSSVCKNYDFNNGEGNIFKIIPGPGNANPNTLDEFIATKHHKNAEHLAKHFGFSYIKVEDELTLDRVLENFFKPDAQPKFWKSIRMGKTVQMFRKLILIS